MENRKYVAYYRVSTQKQGQSGLGLEGQQQYVKNFTKDCRDCVIAEFIEVESGRKDNRAELNKAIEFNGKYWHYNENFKPGKHALKSNLCRKKGIKLLHIREDLWLRDKEKMKNVICDFLKL